MVALVILDGFGYRKEDQGNAIARANTPTLNFLQNHFPSTHVPAAESAVGLPRHCVGNSQAGHATLGAGRIVLQPITILETAIQSREFFKNPLLKKSLSSLTPKNRVHIFCLASNAGVHSMIDHAIACDTFLQKNSASPSFIHAFLDGRDAPTRSASIFLEKITRTSIIGSVSGRFYAMDRDANWERTKACYRMLTIAGEPPFTSWQDTLAYYYRHAITDEFIPPTLLHANATIKPGDGIIFMNVRPDRARQLTQCFVNAVSVPFKAKDSALSFFVTPFTYGNHALPTCALYSQQPIQNTLKERLSSLGKTIFTVAETEKYAHVTYFFDGNREQSFPGETRVLIQSLREKNYAKNPAMSAPAITSAVLNSLNNKPCDFYLINYANADMVGHSGNLSATTTAIECLDREVARLYDCIVIQHNGTLIITGDHGKAELMYNNSTHQPCTEHTTSLVPVIVVAQKLKDSSFILPINNLADIAPFILSLFNPHEQ